MIFVDTNYFLRFLLQDNQDQHSTARRLFESAAQGKIILCTSVVVIFEVYWVLKSFYQKQKPELVHVLQNIFQMKFIKFEQVELLKKALVLFEKHTINLPDAYNLAFAKKQKAYSFQTFDQKLDALFKNS